MRIVVLLLLIFSAVCSVGLADVEDASLGALLSGDWQALLPSDAQALRTQLLKLLAPAPAPAPAKHQHAPAAHRTFRLQQ